MKLIRIIPFVFGINAGDLCGKIRLREDAPYGTRISFNPDNEALPNRTQKRLRAGGCDDDDFLAFADRIEEKSLAALRCQFPRPKKPEKTRDVLYVKCSASKNRGDRESSKHDEILGKGQKLKCRNGDFLLGKIERQCEKLRKKQSKKESE